MNKIIYLILSMYLLWSCAGQSAHDHSGHEHAEETHAEHEHDSHSQHEEHHDHKTAGHREPHDEHEGHGEHDEKTPALDESQLGLSVLTMQDFTEIVSVSGEIVAAQGDEAGITAVHGGLVVFSGTQLFPGKQLRSGDVLMTISGKELIHDNIELGYAQAYAKFENAKSDFERALELNKDKIVSDNDFLDIKAEYEKAKKDYELIKKHYSEGGQKVVAPMNAYVKDVLVKQGEYVAAGQTLVSLTKNKRLVLRADVPLRHYQKLHSIRSANFTTPYDGRTYSTGDLNGKLISYGKSAEANSLFAPIYFEINNVGNLMAGAYVEIFLKTDPQPNSIAVPKSALLEEAGRHYVFIKHEGQFEKQFVEIDCFDGMNYHVASGLKAGDVVATKNPYQIKLSMMTSSLPAHSHNH